ncbi:MAG: ATP-binding protein [Pseudomonadales bacterium]|jgi:anti-sigma regulatory factor (Ser/Thr protein kinase)
MEASLELRGEPDQLDTLMAFLGEFWQSAALPEAGRFPFELSLEELFMNVAMHGSAGTEAPRTVEIRIAVDAGEVRVDLKDDGVAFDPFSEAPVPDLDEAIEDRPVGGLGVFLVKEMMDQVAYERRGQHNCLTLRKRIDA